MLHRHWHPPVVIHRDLPVMCGRVACLGDHIVMRTSRWLVWVWVSVGIRMRGVVPAGAGLIGFGNVNPEVFQSTMRSPKHAVPLCMRLPSNSRNYNSAGVDDRKYHPQPLCFGQYKAFLRPTILPDTKPQPESRCKYISPSSYDSMKT